MTSTVTPRIKAGDKIGRWTVLGDYVLTQRNERKWLCRCVCGTQRYVLERSLLYGGSVSCGCLRKERALEANSPDLTGRQFGELTVIHKVENTKHNAAQWLCRCSCGTNCVVQGSLLVTGRKTRCAGNNHEKNYTYVDITGQRFGRLVALYPSKRFGIAVVIAVMRRICHTTHWYMATKKAAVVRKKSTIRNFKPS